MKDERNLGEKISDWIFLFGASWHFIFLSILIIVSWIMINIFMIAYQFDKYPFILLNLFLSLIAAFQAPFILMSQKRVEIKQDIIYRNLFQEIKELVEADLSLEQELIEHNKELKGLIEADLNLEQELMIHNKELDAQVKKIQQELELIREIHSLLKTEIEEFKKMREDLKPRDI